MFAVMVSLCFQYNKKGENFKSSNFIIRLIILNSCLMSNNEKNVIMYLGFHHFVWRFKMQV